MPVLDLHLIDPHHCSMERMLRLFWIPCLLALLTQAGQADSKDSSPPSASPEISTVAPGDGLKPGRNTPPAGVVKLPAGPEGPGRFGAYQTRLAFTPEWDAPWRLGPRADVVVRFDATPARLVFWHGTNFVPCWVNEAGAWYSDGAVLRPGAGPHQDRLCRFSFASVIEANDARVVVRWRYAPVDANGELVNEDPVTRWNDWVDEFYTIYPDATGVRAVTLHSSNWTQPYWLQQSILIRQPGEPGTSAAIAPQTSELPGGRMASIRINGGNPFHVVAAPAAKAEPPAAWGDWPARGAAGKPGHQIIAASNWTPWAGESNKKQWRMLVGLETDAKSTPRAAAQSWLSPPTLTIAGTGFQSSSYQAGEKAYLVGGKPDRAPGAVKMTLAGSPSSPVVNPAFVIKGWGKSPVNLTLNGTRAPWGPDSRHGYRKTATGADLVVWVRVTATAPTTFELQPVSDESE